MKKKITITIIAAAVLSVLAAASVFFGRAPGKITELSVDPFGDGEYMIDALPASENTFRLFLPSDTDFSSMKLYFEADSAVRLNIRKISSGKVCSAIKGDGEYKLSAGSTQYSLSVVSGSDIPALFITTESGSLDYLHKDKENKEKGSIIVCENGKPTLSTELKSIKGRGYTSWLSEKKSYNIKFNEKQSLFGMEPAKKWSLVACSSEDTLLKCQIGFELAKFFGVNCACDYSPAEIYINGEYRGTFLVCESVGIGEGRIDITDLEKLNEKANPGIDEKNCAPRGDLTDEKPGSRKWVDLPNSPKDITGGYLLEFDRKEIYPQEASIFISPLGQYIVVKEPEYCTEDEINYIADWYAPAEEALAAEDGYNSAGKHYSEYFDVDSLARLYILQEYIQNTDGTFSSCFFYKDKGNGKLYAGPAWDLEGSMNPEMKIVDGSKLYADRWYTGVFASGSGFTPSVFRLAFIHEDFRDKVNEIWNSFGEEKIREAALSYMDGLYAKTEKSLFMDMLRWDAREGSAETSFREEFSDNLDRIRTFFENRTPALTKGFSKDCAMLFYDINGGEGFMYDNIISLIGESHAVKDLPMKLYGGMFPPAGKNDFECWNTEKDGTGTDYRRGDMICLTDRTTILYAKWK